MVPLIDLYSYYCRRLGCSPNSALADYLRRTEGGVLTIVDVSSNYVGKRGLIPVLDLVKNTKTVKILDLSNNAMAEAQVQHLAYCLALHPSIELVRLRNTSIHDGCIDPILQLLELNSGIVDVDVADNDLNPASVACIDAQLRRNAEVREKEKLEQKSLAELLTERAAARALETAQIHSQISAVNSGGYVHCASWWKNPQYMIHQSHSSRVSIKLELSNGEAADQVGFLVMRHDGVHRVIELEGTTIVTESPVDCRKCMVEVYLNSDESYVVMPFSFNPGRAITFTLTAALVHDGGPPRGSWITLDTIDVKYDWSIKSVDAAWMEDTAGGGGHLPTWRLNTAFHLRASSSNEAGGLTSTSMVYILLIAEEDASPDLCKAIGLDVVRPDTKNAGVPPLSCTSDVIRGSYPHEKKPSILLKLRMRVSDLDVYAVPSTLAAGEIGPYTVVVFSTMPIDVEMSVFPHGWRYRRVEGQWESHCCGGSREWYESWKNNPSISVVVEDSSKPLVAFLEAGPQSGIVDTVSRGNLSASSLAAEEEEEDTDTVEGRLRIDLRKFRERHQPSSLLVRLSAVDAMPPDYAPRAVSDLAPVEASLVVADTSPSFYLVASTQHPGQRVGYTLHLFSLSSFIVNDVESLADRERQCQLEEYRRQNEARAIAEAEDADALGSGDQLLLQQLRKEILEVFDQTGTMFMDRDFPSGNSSLFLDVNAKPPSNFSAVYTWKRTSDICLAAHCLGDGLPMSPPFALNCRQWFVSALHAVAAKPQWLSRIFIGYFKTEGFAQFNFYKCNEWIGVTVDDFLVVDGLNQLIMGHSIDRTDMFVPLAEKAYAKLHRCYEALEPKVTPELRFIDLVQLALTDLSGGINTVYTTRDANGNEMAWPKRDALWRKLKEAIKSTTLCSLLLRSESSGSRERSHAGILPDHLYGVMDARFIEQQRLVKVRNWNDGVDTQWKGKWAPHSPLWTDTLLGLLQYDHTQSEIWLHYDELLYYFSDVIVTETYANTDMISGTFAEGSTDPADADISLCYPQYALTLSPHPTAGDVTMDVIIGLHRRDARMSITRAKEATVKYRPALGLAVLSTDDNQRRVTKLGDESPIQLLSPRLQRDMYCSISVDAEMLLRQKFTVMPFHMQKHDRDTMYWLSASCAGSMTVRLTRVEPNVTVSASGKWRQHAGDPTCSFWRDNPEFFLSLAESMEIYISLQLDRQPTGEVGFTVHNTKRCSSFLQFDDSTVVAHVTATSPGEAPRCRLRLSGSTERRGMPYVIVPYCSDAADRTGTFVVETTANRAMKLSAIEPRLDWHRVTQLVTIRADDGTAGGGPGYPSWRYSPQLVLSFPVEREGRVFIHAVNRHVDKQCIKLGMLLLTADNSHGDTHRRRLAYAKSDVVAMAPEAVGEVMIDASLSLPHTEEPLILVVYTVQPYKEVDLEVYFYSAPLLEVSPVTEWSSMMSMEGAWDLGMTAGGSRESFSSWINNPFYGLSVLRPTHVVAILVQYPRGREKPVVKRFGNRKSFVPPPITNVNRLTSIQLDLVNRDADLSSIASTCPTTEAEVVLSMDLTPDKPYLLVPCTTIPQMNSDFKLFVFANYPIDLFEAEKPRLYYV